MQIVIDIPNKDIPKHQEVIDIRLHFIDGHIVDADGYGFVELPKGHGRLIDADELMKNWYGEYIKFMTREEIESMDGIIENAQTIIEADREVDE